MRYAGRLARLFRKAALLPPRDPLAAMSDADMARASKLIEAKTLGDGWFPEGRPAIAPEDAAWFEAAIRPFLPAYAAFCARYEAWRRRIDPPRGAWARRAAACNFPAFAGRPRPQLRLPAGLVADFIAAAAPIAA
jgi:hypothetical protein